MILTNSTKAAKLDVALQRYFKARQNLITAQVAYETVPWVRNAVDKIADAVSRQPFDVYRGGEKVAQEDTYKDVDELADVNMRGLLNALAGDLLLYGYAHIALDGVQGFERVKRKAAANIYYQKDTTGAIYLVEYRRGTYRKTCAPWDRLDEGGMPYIWLPNRKDDEGPGKPPVIAALKAADLLDSAVEHAKFYFDSGGAGPVLVEMPDYATATEAEKERVKSWFDEMVNRAKQAFRALPTGQNIEVHRLGYPLKDLDTTALTADQKESIAGAFQMPSSLMFANAANFATAQIDKLNFHDYAVNPLADVVFDALNERWWSLYGLELVPMPVRLHVYQERELERTEKLALLADRGHITRNELREETGREPLTDDDADEPDDVTEDEPDTRQEDAIERLEDRVGLRSVKFQDSGPAYAYLPLANNQNVLEIVRLLRDELGNVPGIEWQSAPTYHVTLCYALEATGTVLQEVSKRVQAQNIRLFDAGLGVFENGDERALHMRLEPEGALVDLQTQLYAAFNSFGVPMSPFSNPQQYQPHVTLAYLPQGLDVSDLIKRFNMRGMLSTMVNQYIISREAYEPEVIVFAPEYKTLDVPVIEDSAAGDLDKWRVKAVKRWKEGTPEKGREFESEYINAAMKAAIVGQLEAAQSVEDVEAAFVGAEVWAGYG